MSGRASAPVVLSGLLVIGFGIGTGEHDPQGWLLSLYSLICIFVASRVIDYAIDGASYDKLLFIIGNTHSEPLRQYIINDMERGGTYIKSSGMYSNNEKEMIFLVVSRREVAQVQRKIREIDPTLFLVVTDAYDTYGEWELKSTDWWQMRRLRGELVAQHEEDITTARWFTRTLAK